MYYDNDDFLYDDYSQMAQRLPGMPGRPSMPGIPGMPGMPGMPATPSMPGMPTTPPWGNVQPGTPSQQSPMQPMSAPPSFTPTMGSWQTGHRGIRSCMHRNTYIWLNNGNSFWFFPTFVGHGVLAGFRWRRRGWVFHSVELNRILSYQCF